MLMHFIPLAVSYIEINEWTAFYLLTIVNSVGYNSEIEE